MQEYALAEAGNLDSSTVELLVKVTKVLRFWGIY